MSSAFTSGFAPFSALNAFSQGMETAAQNLANISTAGFSPLRVDYATGPAGQGVQAQGVQAQVVGGGSGSIDFSGDIGSLRENTQISFPPEGFDPSGTDVASETVLMTMLENAFGANAVAVGALDSLLGTVVDMVG